MQHKNNSLGRPMNQLPRIQPHRIPLPASTPTSPASPAFSTSAPSFLATYSRTDSPRARNNHHPNGNASQIQIFPASNLASSPSFEEWRRGTALNVPIEIYGSSRWNTFPVPPIVQDLGNYVLDVRLPGWLTDVNLPAASEDPACPIITAVQLPGNRPLDISGEEDTTLKQSYDRIFEESRELSRLSNWHSKSEKNWSIPIDNLIRKAFIDSHPFLDVKPIPDFDFVCDLLVDMPYSSSFYHVEPWTKADTIISATVFPNPSMFTLGSQILEELGIFTEERGSPVLRIPHLMVKHRGSSEISSLDEAQRELFFSLASGMHQRRLLGLDNHVLFGLACNAGKVRVYASYWQDNKIQLLRLCSSDLDLRVIEQCCLFFLLLRRIRLYNLSSTADFASLDGNLLKQRVFSSQRSWKTNLATLGSQARVSYQNKWWTPGHSNPSRGGCSLGTPFLAFPRRNSEMELDER